MYARVVQVNLQPGTVDQVVNYFRDSVGPALKTYAGFKNSRLLTNPTTNQCLMVTLWETEAHRQGAESSGFLQQVLKEMGELFTGAPTVDYYEVNVQVTETVVGTGRRAAHTIPTSGTARRPVQALASLTISFTSSTGLS